MRHAGVVCACLAVGSMSVGCSNPTAPDPFLPEVVFRGLSSRPEVAIPNRYIVVLKNDVPDVAAETSRQLQRYGGSLHFAYSKALKGYAATFPAGAIQGLSQFYRDERLRTSVAESRRHSAASASSAAIRCTGRAAMTAAASPAMSSVPATIR